MGSNKDHGWTDERSEQLKVLWNAGLSARMIAAQLGNISRNGVIGRAHRMGLMTPKTNGHGGKRVPKVVWPKQARTLPEPPPVVDPEPAAIDGNQITLLTLETTHCRWPIGDPKQEDFHFCGHTRRSGSPYCSGHHARAFQPAQPRKDAA